jgi:2,3-diketo-5-methylthio-1-phosphopentane phosphatase
LEKTSKPVALLIDFDGTAALDNVGMALIGAFARDDSWRVIDEDYLKGRIGSRRAYQLLEGLMAETTEVWRSYALAHHHLDNSFKELVERAQGAGWLTEVLSDGFDTYIAALLEREGVDVAVKSSVVTSGAEGTKFSAPHMDPTCGRCGTCKHWRVTSLQQRGYHVIFIGDGLSDKCASQHADRIFAKDILADHLTELGVAYENFKNLSDVIKALFADVNERETTNGSQPGA